MIVELNDSIQKTQPKTTTPVKAQNQNSSSAKQSIPGINKGMSQGKTNIQNSAKTQAAGISGTSKPKTLSSEHSNTSNGVHVNANSYNKTAENPQTEMQPQQAVLGTDSVSKTLTQASDTIQKAKKDSVATDAMPLFYKEHFIPGDSIKWTSLGHQPSGFEGFSMPYRLKNDDGITGLLLFCFIITSYVLTFGKKSIIEQAKSLFSRKEQAYSFGKATGSDLRHRIMLRIQTCILMGVFIFSYFNDYNPNSYSLLPRYYVLGIYIGICIIFYIIKRLIYQFLGWVFFDKYITSSWIGCYSTIINFLGFCYFPLVLLMVYYNLSAPTILIIGLFLIIFAKILMFYKWLKFFFNNLHGLLYLIVYFCALEILPCFLLVQGLLQTNIILQLKL